MQVKLTGNWETVVGEQDTFVHILEYENYSGLDRTLKLLKSSSEVCAYHNRVILALIK
jgi:hypothetical protein